jgi:4-carboxymuconolactone decarboxylase
MGGGARSGAHRAPVRARTSVFVYAVFFKDLRRWTSSRDTTADYSFACNFGRLGEPLQRIINTNVYGDVWSRTALPAATKSLIMVGMMAAAGQLNELRVHLNGAIKNGCTEEQILEVLLLITFYCGVPAANDAHRIAAETLGTSRGAETP